MENKKKDYLLPLSILIAAILISGSWIYTAGLKNANPEDGSGKVDNGPSITGGNVSNLKPITLEDNILGNPEAPVKVVEFSDFECPFCKAFHATMSRIMSEYGNDGRVAWVYRHFPLDQLHPIKARKAAIASECAAELGGKEKFWVFAEEYFRVTPSNNQISLAELPKIAEKIGLNKSDFEACLESGKYDKKINDQINDAANAGGRGTPYSVVVAKDGRNFTIEGAQPYEQVKMIIEEALR